MAASSLAAPLALLVPRIDDRGGILLAALLVYLCVAGILLIASAWTLTPEERALRRAERDIRGGEPPGRIVPRLRRVDLRGRPRLHRDLAVRCLERSELSHVQERVLREQAGMWIEKARDGLRKEVRE